MAAIDRIRPWLFAGIGLLVVTGIGLVAWDHFRPGDPCAELDRETLFMRYPSLERLWASQQGEAERLLARHRVQDIVINLELGGERITPEEALRLSLNQVNELSAMRREHKEIFYRRCREVAGGA